MQGRVAGLVWNVEVGSCAVLEQHLDRRAAALPGLAKPGDKKIVFFRARFGPKRQIDGLSRCHGWIGVEKLPQFHLPRAPTDVWDPFFRACRPEV